MNLKPATDLPELGSLNVSELLEYGIVIKRATVASPAKITTAERFSSKTFNLGEGAEVYTFISTRDFSKKEVPLVDAFRSYLDAGEIDEDFYTGMDYSFLNISGFDGTFAVTTITDTDYEYTIVFDPQSGEFDWSYSGYIYPFDGELPFTKHGTFVKTGDGNNEAFTLTAEDNSVIILFKYLPGGSDCWVLAYYPVMEYTEVFFNDAAARYIIDQWKTDFAPLW
jgi:hypothetical protein